jgi:hypothetical protein
MPEMFDRLDEESKNRLQDLHKDLRGRSMGATINLDQFKVFTMPEQEWFKKFFRVDVKYHDAVGVFGPQRYDYFIYWKGSSVDSYGASNPHILVCTPKSLSKMRPDRKADYRRVLKRHGIDLDQAEKERLVVAAKDQAFFSSIGRDSLTLFFTRKKIEKKEPKKEE